MLYVGHSDTLGPLLKKLGHEGEFALGDDQYGNLLVVVPAAAKPVVVRLHYLNQ